MKTSTRVRVAAVIVLVFVLALTLSPFALAKGGTGATGDGAPPWVENHEKPVPGAAWSKPGTWVPPGQIP
jgi:hypothetical protein